MKSHIARVVALAVAIGMLVPLTTDPSIAGALDDAPPAVSEDTPTGSDAEPSPEQTPTLEHGGEPGVTEEEGPTEGDQPTPAPTLEPTPTEPAEDGDAGEEQAPIAPFAVGAAPTIPGAGRVAMGSDRYVAAVNATKRAFPGGAGTVLLTLGTQPIYAEIAAGLAAPMQAAMLYTTSASIPSAVWTELQRLAPSTVIVVGGTTAVSDAVMDRVRTLTSDVRRIGGASATETARLVFEAGTTPADTVFLAGGTTHDDAAIAVTAAASAGKRPLIVNGQGSGIDTATLQALRTAGATSIVLIGSTARVSSSYEASLSRAGFAVSRIVDADRYTLAAKAAAARPGGATRPLVVNPDRPQDLGIATAMAAALRQPLLYSIPPCVPDAAAAQIAAIGSPLLIGDAASLSAAVASNTSCSTERSRREAALNSAIRSTIANYPGSYSVTVRQFGGLGEVTHVYGGQKREPASMMKIFAAWAAYKRIEQGRASFDTVLPSGVQLWECVQFIIHVSDNYCHTDIVHWIGIANINAMIKSAGFVNTYYGSVPRGTSVLYAGNRTTSNDLAWMMERLAKGTVLKKALADRLINLMRSQIWRSRVASGIPPGVPQGTKPGSLWVASGLMQGDTGVVNGPRGSYFISIIGDDNPPQAALRAISRTVYTHFNGSFGTAASYPVQQMITRIPSNLRSSPGGSIVATIPSGVLLQVHDAQRRWYQVQYGSRKLWVYYTGLRNR